MLRLECTTNGKLISLPDSRRCNWRPNTRGIDRSLRDSRRGHSRRRGLSPLYRFAIPADTPGGPLDYIWRSLGLNMEVSKTTSGGHLDYIWRSFRLHLEVTWTKHGSQFDYIWRSFRLHLEVTWTKCGSHWEYIWKSCGLHAEAI